MEDYEQWPTSHKPEPRSWRTVGKGSSPREHSQGLVTKKVLLGHSRDASPAQQDSIITVDQAVPRGFCGSPEPATLWYIGREFGRQSAPLRSQVTLSGGPSSRLMERSVTGSRGHRLGAAGCWDSVVSVLLRGRRAPPRDAGQRVGAGQRLLTVHPHQCFPRRSPASFAVKQPRERFSQQNVKWKLWVLFLGHSFGDMRIPFMLPFPIPWATYWTWLDLRRILKCRGSGPWNSTGRKVVLKP